MATRLEWMRGSQETRPLNLFAGTAEAIHEPNGSAKCRMELLVRGMDIGASQDRQAIRSGYTDIFCRTLHGDLNKQLGQKRIRQNYNRN